MKIIILYICQIAGYKHINTKVSQGINLAILFVSLNGSYRID